jgi:hypothetical protein
VCSRFCFRHYCCDRRKFQNLKNIIAQKVYTERPHHSSSGLSLAYHRAGPGSSPGLVMWDLWWTRWRWGRFSPSTSVSPANLHSTSWSTIILIYHRGLYNRPEVTAVPSGLSPTPPIIIKKSLYRPRICKFSELLKRNCAFSVLGLMYSLSVRHAWKTKIQIISSKENKLVLRLTVLLSEK